ncbi:MAG: subclass B3 metallo-beta-lactamase [Sphingobium sp.]|nr:subclass B3 metallo-beta-lactamase [Sphingobium sp.]
MKRWIGAGIMSLAAGFGAMAAGVGQPDDPLLRPIAPDYARRWLEPQPSFRVFGQSYLVGFDGLSVGLIRTSKGLILIDGAVPQAVPALEANIRKLGFALRDIKYILSTEPHYDHAGGIAALARDSGATVLAGAAAVEALRSGRPDPNDPQAAILPPQPGIARLRAVRDGERIQLGDTVVTAIATPGHTAGSTSWAWRSCEGRSCRNIVFAASLNAVSADDYRFSDPAHRAIVDTFRRSFRRMRALPCDILLTSHPEQPQTRDRAARLAHVRVPNPFVDATACRVYADSREKTLGERLKDEAGGR